ncbi:hypothetical protein Rhopal_004155-T1 [Rhodotorula paludigena]|uniref:Knr4/Smi1-like domain-containing protein n=1 Tax=Rhodotorula paludigena TaxID=86838 RepID=A0AAV5GP34_9BASI|nr:hypothetical protein Rhopal_004155-T1 [Rhodotorula paludigena]
MFSFLFGGSASSKKRVSHPFPSSSRQRYPPSDSTHPYGGSTGTPAGAEGGYDDVALGGGGDLAGGGIMAASRTSFSAPAATDGSFVGTAGESAPSTSYTVESSYPPLPSFSRPSSSASSAAAATRYPPLAHTFARLHALLDAQSPSLLDTLSPPLSPSDPALDSLAAAIAPYRLPPAVVESYLHAHDGQDSLSFGGATVSGGGSAGGASLGGKGLVYGLWWLPLERVEEEWRFWRRLESAGGLVGAGVGGDAFAANAGEMARRQRGAGGRTHPYVPEEQASRAGPSAVDGGEEAGTTMQGMSSFPAGWVRNRYSHPGWLPLLTDHCGNYIGVDLDPPPPSSPTSPTRAHAAPGAPGSTARTYGQPGQVIAFGREIDEKVVLFPGDGPGGWARFLAAFVDDVEKGEFARLGERPARSADSDEERWDGAGEDEERQGGAYARRRDSDSSGEFDDGDGLGERGYFESDMYGEEVIGSGPGARSAQTWVLRSEYRRLDRKLDLPGGIIGLLCERSRRKWRALGVGSAQPQAHSMMSVAGARRPLSVVVSAGVETKPEDEDEPKSAATERPAASDVKGKGKENDAPADAAAGTLSPSLVLSPPSPEVERAPQLPSQASSRSNSSSFHLGDPPRTSSSASGPRAPRRPPPPPAAPIDLPTFSELDFSDLHAPSAPGERPVVIPRASWLLSDANNTGGGKSRSPSGGVAGGMLSRLSFGSSAGTRSPPDSATILPLSRAPSHGDLRGEDAHGETVAQIGERNTSRTALVASSPEQSSPVEGPASPVEHVQVVSHVA